MEPLWTLINLNQAIFLFPLLSLDLPANSLLLFQTLDFALGDFFFFDLIYSATFEPIYPSSPSPTPYSSNFQSLGKPFSYIGYESHNVF